jgi:transcriptional regulator with XRE-family HTH domain
MPPVKRKYPNIPDGFMAEAKRVRTNLKMTLRELSDISDIPTTTLSQFETGSRNPSYEHCIAIKKSLNLDIELPVPDLEKREPIRRNRKKGKLKTEAFMIEVDGRLIEVLRYRDYGFLKHGHKQ